MWVSNKLGLIAFLCETLHISSCFLYILLLLWLNSWKWMTAIELSYSCLFFFLRYICSGSKLSKSKPCKFWSSSSEQHKEFIVRLSIPFNLCIHSQWIWTDRQAAWQLYKLVKCLFIKYGKASIFRVERVLTCPCPN